VRATRIPPTIRIQCSALDPRFTLAAKKIAVRRWSGLVGSANYFPPKSTYYVLILNHILLRDIFLSELDNH
jgi:hypothetical protein